MQMPRWRRRLVSLFVCLGVGVSLAQHAAGQGTQSPASYKLVLVDRAANQTLLGEVPGNTWGPRVSPEGRRLTFTLPGNARAGDLLYIGAPMNSTEMRLLGPAAILCGRTMARACSIRGQARKFFSGDVSIETRRAISSSNRRARLSQSRGTAEFCRMSSLSMTASRRGRSIWRLVRARRFPIAAPRHSAPVSRPTADGSPISQRSRDATKCGCSRSGAPGPQCK
jgi:hypothetical protein